ncbi:unnamed protein product [Adineta ricciae]|uniref:G-protein coupled receptors family 1 profile domain-containing protein n=1 Tax=Adineta ricciae TaxID=249248 RepID=A0A815RAV8_ADIRI|nr:unnamed protein product [Adineta ricciae]CAF1474094.1 unnamed protein product [Adineta ricciae]
MSSSIISTLNFISQQISIYIGLTILILGVVGGCLNVLVFVSLRTFRQSSCACHLIIMSIFNIGQLVVGLSARALETNDDINAILTSFSYCQYRQFTFQACVSISLASICFATIDQYWATCSRPKWRQWCNIKLALRLNLISIIISLLHCIPYLFFSNRAFLPTTNRISCIVTNKTYQQYRDYVLIPFINRLIPLTIIFTFGLLAYRNVQQIAYRTVPIVRRELDKQLTTMVLVQAAFICLTITPYLILNSITSYTNLAQNATTAAILSLMNIIILCFYYLSSAGPFYIYLSVSERFRRQFLYVIGQIHANKCTKPRIARNQVMPDDF